jgi:hypothetical protein
MAPDPAAAAAVAVLGELGIFSSGDAAAAVAAAGAGVVG